MDRDRRSEDDAFRDGLVELTGDLYRSLVEQVPAVVYVDSNAQLPDSLYISPQAEQIFGYPPERFLANSELWRERTHLDDRPIVAAMWARARQNGSTFELEYRFRRADDREIWIRDSAVPVRDDDGTIRFWQGLLHDVTPEKRTENALREAEQRYRALVENLPAVVYQVAPDDDRRTLYASSQVERALGYSREEWLDQPDIWVELLHPDDREPTLAAHDEHNLTGEPWSREYRLIASDGRAVWFRDVATLARDPQGRPLYWQGVQLDITELKRVEGELRAAKDELEVRVAARTAELEEANALMSLEIGERRRAEEELRTTELRYRVLAEQLPAVTYVWSVDPSDESAPYYTSPRIEQLLGYTVQEWETDPDFWMNRLHPDDRQVVLTTAIRSETTGEPFSMEYRFLHKDGHIVWVLDEAILLERDETGKPRIFQGVTIDITSRKTAEARATEADERYRTLVEQIPAITYIEVPSPGSPDETRLVYLSPQTREILGFTAEELIADPSHLVWMLHPDDRERVISLNASCERKGEPFDCEYRVIAKDGTVVWLHSKATLVRDAAGTPRFWHGVSVDVSALHRAKEEVQELRSRYEELTSRVTPSERSGD